MAEPYVALTPLRAPGTMVFGFQPGDGVPQDTVENWELVIGVDVMPRDTGVVARPDRDSDDRAAWEAYAIGQGTPVQDARAASLTQLRKTPEPATDADTGGPVVLADPFAAPERPAPGAKKADWIEYVIATGADKAWANDPSTTKADLQDYENKRDVVPNEPAPADPVATGASAAQADANADGDQAAR